ncbi:MAG: flavin reductase family protein [Clostridia bacterium]|nr:flavin reductase family protein [Clostridia bacterium]
MSKIAWKGGALLGPLPPVMVSCGDGERDNIITVAWTGITCTHPPKTYISIRPSRHSYPIIKASGEFVINLALAALVRSVDYCGIYTGAKVDKFAKCKLTREPAQVVKCPMIAEAPLSLECRVTDILPLGSHDMFLADIVAVNVDEALLDEKGALRLSRAGLAAFAHGEYFELGRRIGKFGFSAAKKKPNHHTAKGKKS